MTPLMAGNDHIALLQRYSSFFSAGERPPPEAEPSTEQLTCLKALLESDLPPSADFAIFGPHGARLQGKMKLQGQRFTSDGQRGPIEIAGPPDLDI